MYFLCCGSFKDIKNSNTSTKNKKAWKAVPATSIRGSLIRTYDTDIDDTYYLDRDTELGKGGCGVVVIGEHKETHVQYAIKIVNKASAERGRLDRELKLLKDVDHANIVRLFSVYESSAYMYFIMELCLGGHLGNLIARQPNKFLDEDWAKRLCRQILSAVSHIHSRGIAHRDIKLQNILIDCNNDKIAQIKLIDFGYGSRYIGNLPMKTKCGTPYTTAPEVIRENYDERCDVWSVGVVLYIMLSGRRPFEALDIGGPLTDAGKAAMITNILAGRFHFNHRPFQTCSRTAVNFVKTLLHQDYRTRVRSDEALENPWLNESLSKTAKPSPLLSAKSFKAVHKLKKSQEHSPMQRTGMFALVFGIQSKASTDLRAVFQSFDTDSSGAISRKEFHTAMNKLAPELTEDDINRLFDMIDIDKNQQLSFTEFLIASLDPREVDVEELNNAFRVLDEDGNGFITKDELRKIIKTQLIQALENESRNENGELVKPLDQKEVSSLYNEVENRLEAIFEAVDINNDEKISRAEFLWAMTGSTEFLPRDAKPQRTKSVFVSPDHAHPIVPKRAASFNNASSRKSRGSSNRSSPFEPENGPSSRQGSARDRSVSPPNFIGILARNQLHQHAETNKISEPSPKMEVKNNGSIAHYTKVRDEPVTDEHPEESSSSYDHLKPFGRPSSRQSSGKNNNHNLDEFEHLKGSFKAPFSPDRDTIYRMSEAEEEKSEFSVSPKVVPALSFRPSTLIDNPENGLKPPLDPELKSPSTTFRPKMSSRATSFKRDISAKFVDINSVDHNDAQSDLESDKAPLSKVGSRQLSRSLSIKNINN